MKSIGHLPLGPDGEAVEVPAVGKQPRERPRDQRENTVHKDTGPVGVERHPDHAERRKHHQHIEAEGDHKPGEQRAVPDPAREESEQIDAQQPAAEKRRENDGHIVDALFGDVMNSDRAADHAGRHQQRHGFCETERLTVGFALAEPFVEIDGADGRDAVDRAGERTHRRRETGRNDPSGHEGRQLRENEVRQHLVGGQPGDGFVTEHMVERKEADAEEEETSPRRQAHEDAQQRRLARFTGGFRGDVTLDHILVAGIFGHEADDADQQRDQESAVVQREAHRAEAEFVILHADVENLRKASGHLECDQGKAEHTASEQQDRLHHIGPDHRLEAAEYGIAADYDSGDRDDRKKREAGHLRHRQRDQVQDGRKPDELQDDEADRRITAHTAAVARFEILECAGHPAAPEERDEEVIGHRRSRENAERLRELPEIQRVGRRRQRQEGHRADRGAEHRQPDRPAGKRAVAEEVVLGAFVFPGEVDTHQRHRDEIEHQCQQVSESEHGCFSDQIVLPFQCCRIEHHVFDPNAVPGVDHVDFAVFGLNHRRIGIFAGSVLQDQRGLPLLPVR